MKIQNFLVPSKIVLFYQNSVKNQFDVRLQLKMKKNTEFMTRNGNTNISCDEWALTRKMGLYHVQYIQRE